MGLGNDGVRPVILYLPTGPLSNRVLLTKADPQEVPASDLIRASQEIVQVITHREEAASQTVCLPHSEPGHQVGSPGRWNVIFGTEHRLIDCAHGIHRLPGSESAR